MEPGDRSRSYMELLEFNEMENTVGRQFFKENYAMRTSMTTTTTTTAESTTVPMASASNETITDVCFLAVCQITIM